MGTERTWREDRRSAESPGQEAGVGGRDPRRTGESYARAVETDGELLSRVRTGDEEAFVMLVARYQQPMLRLACSMVPNQQVAEEAVQDTWLGVVRGIEGFEGRSSFKTWLFRILVNRARSAGSREPTDPSIETIPAVDADPLRCSGPMGRSRRALDRARAKTDSMPPPGCRSSNLLWMNCLPVSARWSCCVTSRAFPATKRAPHLESVKATSGSCCTGDGPAYEKSSTPRSRRADRAIAASERPRVSAGGRTYDRLSRRGSLPSGSKAIRDSFETVPQLCRLPEQIKITIRLAGQIEPEDLTPEARQDLIELYQRWRLE